MKKKLIEQRKGDWIVTFSGKRFFPFDPGVEDIDVNDIIHALSNLCRFNGHSTTFYSVAQHAILVSLLCPPEHQLYGLLHDASEAYLADIPSPLKKLAEFQAYRDAEKRLMGVICNVFGLPGEEPAIVKVVDKRMLSTEARDLTFTQGMGWTMNVEPYDFHIKPWAPDYAKIRFMARFHELTGKR